MPNPYEVLGLTPDASVDDVRRRYRELAARYHPDRGSHEWILKTINDAYDEIERLRSVLPQPSHWVPDDSGAPPVEPAVQPSAVVPSADASRVGTLTAGALIGAISSGFCSQLFGLNGLVTVLMGSAIGLVIAYVQQPTPDR